MMRALAEVFLAAIVASLAAFIASALAILIVVMGPVLALGAAAWFTWSQSSSTFRQVAFGFLLAVALYGAATAGAMLRLGAAP
jgi:hypothetical protein